jgi:hypothetical protein
MQIRTALDGSPAGPLRVISLRAGQGCDLLEVLAEHPRRDDVPARLVELDERNTAFAIEVARTADLGQGMRAKGIVSASAADLLNPTYRNGVQADGFQVPAELADLLEE